MAQLDRLLSVMVSNRADALMLHEGDLAKLEMLTGARPVTKSALTGAQVLGLLKEIAPQESIKQMDEGRPASFAYASSDGAFGVQATLEEGKWRVATGDQSTVKKFLAANPGFSKGFRIQQPRVYIKQNDKWIEFNPQRGNRNK